jgi:general secretion pathway protein M
MASTPRNAAPASSWQIINQRWQALATRERTLIALATTLVFAALLWWLGIAPALSTLRQTRAAAPQLEAQWQLMRSQAAEAATLKAQRALSYDESLRALENSIKTLGTGASLNVNDSRASITLKAVSADALAQWLAQARANARLVPSELRLQKSAASTPATTSTSATTTATTATLAATWDGQMVLTLPAR